MGLDLRPHNHLQHYDMLKDMWVSLAPMPTPRYAATSFLRGSKIYVLGKDKLSVPRLSLLPSLGSVPTGSSACVLSTSLALGGNHDAPPLRELPVRLGNSQKGKPSPCPQVLTVAPPPPPLQPLSGPQGDDSPSMQSMPLRSLTSRLAPGPSSPTFPASGPSPAL